HKGGVSGKVLGLIHLRVSQINGCSFCVDSARPQEGAPGMGDTIERLFAVAAWHESPYFSDAERAALALAESVTRIADQPDPVPDAIWDEAAKHYDEKALAALLIAIATVNAWNRFNVAVRQPAGEVSWH
ncbi:MAG: carboxymuconolactone decarboxylase family protein, partial [Candidatus Dormibacteraceae bacterium]